MDGHVQLVAVRVFDVQELGLGAAGGQRLESEIAPDAVLGVHDRRAGLQVVELADDRFGIAILGPAAALLADTIAEQLLFAQQSEPALR